MTLPVTAKLNVLSCRVMSYYVVSCELRSGTYWVVLSRAICYVMLCYVLCIV